LKEGIPFGERFGIRSYDVGGARTPPLLKKGKNLPSVREKNTEKR